LGSSSTFRKSIPQFFHVCRLMMCRFLAGVLLSSVAVAASTTVEDGRILEDECAISLVQMKAEKAEKAEVQSESRLPRSKSEESKCAECVIWGDPHIITFDVMRKRTHQHPKREALFRSKNWKSDEINDVQVGTFWLVKTHQAWIQGRYWKNVLTNHTILGAIAIGGPILGDDNVMVVRSINSGGNQWNAEAILHDSPSEFHNEYVDAQYHNKSERVATGERGVGVDIDLPQGIKLTVNRWNQMLAAKISMCGDSSQIATLGQCGNNNRNPDDDAPLILMGGISGALAVLPEEVLFMDARRTAREPMYKHPHEAVPLGGYAP